MPNNPELQNKVAELTQQFPTPRVQTDDGNQDVADLHQREDLLLDNYSWVDRAQGKVRIPIERAMEIDCAARTAGSAGGSAGAADGRRFAASGDGAADERICAHRYEQDQAAARKRQKKEQQAVDRDGRVVKQ